VINLSELAVSYLCLATEQLAFRSGVDFLHVLQAGVDVVILLLGSLRHFVLFAEYLLGYDLIKVDRLAVRTEL
jgi:hypothetical protein